MKPNFLFILSDDQGAWALNCAGNSDIHTPNLNKIAENGIRFENFFCASPVCSPARASIVTGETPSCHGVIDWLSAGNANTQNHAYMSEHEHFKHKDVGIEYLEGRPSYVEQLANNGYLCAQSGKWHLGNSECAKKGFEKWFTIFGGGCNYYAPDTFENGHFTYEHRYVTDVITDKAIEYLNEISKDERPFYLGVHYTAPHTPWDEKEHPKQYIDMYRDCEFNATPYEDVHKDQIMSCFVGSTPKKRREGLRGYYAAITAMDANIGRILDELEKIGKADNTVIIFTADNGMNLGQHGIWGKGNGTYPQNMYDTSVKVPFLISAPFIKDKNRVAQELTSACDIFPSLMEMAEIDYNLTDKQFGKSFVPILNNQNINNDTPILISSEYGAVRMIRTETRKLVCKYKLGENEFYDLENDPYEKINLYKNNEYKQEIIDMTRQLEDWFYKYSLEQNDARKFDVFGSGQDDMCNSKNAFRPQHKYFYESKNN